ncbi:MAG TPA: hypothetical protein VKW08_13620 [Xanthobacteraceae bacterium]|nr:hypothetical protein [Xanthobacteraceae bacterium]
MLKRAGYGGLIVLLLLAASPARQAEAVPAFAIQTGQPCAACHVGAFGPQLKPFGRDFKLHGYVGNDGKNHGLPLATTMRTSFTHTSAAQEGGAAPGFRPNDNAIIDIVSLYYAGKIAPNLGGFIEVTFDGVAQRPHLDNVDVRQVWDGQMFGHDLLWGVTVNNGPTVSDSWNSTPVWGFPYNRSPLAPTPTAATLVDWGLAQRSVGVGTYALWDDLLYTEVDVYRGLSAQNLSMLGQIPDDGDVTTGFLPYARVAVIKDWTNHHMELGAYTLSGSNISPWGWYQNYGITMRATDMALDANYQYIFDPTKAASDMLSAHATYIHEDSAIDGNAQAWWFASDHHSLDTLRFDVSFTIGATVTPTIQYFRTTGPSDRTYWWTQNGSPNSDGMIFEVAYVPWGKPNSPFPNMNLRLAVQYVSYFSFDGSTANASNNNNFYFSLWTALKL